MKVFTDKHLKLQKYLLKRDIERWEDEVSKISSNPNQLNINGIWVHDYLNNLVLLHARIVMRTQILDEINGEM